MRSLLVAPLCVLPLFLNGCGSEGTTTTTPKPSEDSTTTMVPTPQSAWLPGLVKDAYPPHYVAQKLLATETITIDGSLDDEAWKGVPFTTQAFDDIAQPRYPDSVVSTGNFTRVKVRWDDDYLYVAAELGEEFVTGTVTGHNSYLGSSRPSYGIVPYFDNDFEVFIDAAMSNWYYKEFEMNYLNATYDVLWRAPDNGLGSVGVPCSQSDDTHWCQNTTFTATSRGGPETWTMFNRSASDPGMETATALIEGGWSLEIKFPLRGNADHGGLIDATAGVDVASTDPSQGARYWWADFSRAEHPAFNYWLNNSNSSNADIAPLCQAVMDSSPTLLGTDKWSCYWEWTWKDVGGHTYMHNPDTFGFLQFAGGQYPDSTVCGNVEWPVRYLLAQIYQAQVQHVITTGAYASSLEDLVNATICTLDNGCYVSKLQLIIDNSDTLHLNLTSKNENTDCVNYNPRGVNPPGAPTGGPCFQASLSYLDDDGNNIEGVVDEKRFMSFAPHNSAACLVGVPESSVVTAYV